VEHATILSVGVRDGVHAVVRGKISGVLQEEEVPMQTSLIIESNGNGKQKLDKLLTEGWSVVSITANHGKSYNDFLVILEKE
jgi:hypothetical protein